MPQHKNYYLRVFRKGVPQASSDARWWGAVIVSIAWPAAVFFWPRYLQPFEKLGWALLLGIFLVLAVIHFVRAQLEIDHEQIVEIERLKGLLTNHTDHRRLSRELTSRHRFANHEFLNQLPLGEEQEMAWDERVDAWLREVEEVMRRHGCGDEEKNHVDTINVPEMYDCMLQTAYRGRHIGIAMLRIRLDRVADIAREHLREAERIANLR